MGQLGVDGRNRSARSIPGRRGREGEEVRGHQKVSSQFLGDKCNGVWVEFILRAKGDLMVIN